jgi:hypothetical protein
MKIKPTTAREPQLTGIGEPYDEGYAEQLDPKTGQDTSDILPGSVELYPVNITVAAGVTHEGDMGRLGKSE